MNRRFGTAAIAALTLAAPFYATAQVPGLKGPSSLAFGYSSQHDTWNTVMLISGVVGIVGLIEGDGALVVLGGVGVLLSAVEMNGSRFQPTSFDRRFDLLRHGALSFGLDSPYKLAPSPGFQQTRPSMYLQYTIRM